MGRTGCALKIREAPGGRATSTARLATLELTVAALNARLDALEEATQARLTAIEDIISARLDDQMGRLVRTVATMLNRG